MSDLFKEKAQDWDARPVPAQISAGVYDAIRQAVPLKKTLRVLDFGAGTGLICGKLAPHVGPIHAVDISEAMLAQLAAKPELLGQVTPHAHNLLEGPLEETVDLVVSAMALHHVEDTAGILQALFAQLAPGGRLALADLDTEDGTFHPPDTPGVYHAGFDRTELTTHLAAVGFTDVAFTTALEVERGGRSYPIFLVTATRPA